MKLYQITQWCHNRIKEQIGEGQLWIDATAGKGHDTLFLAQHVGSSGRVLAFDIQAAAVDQTRARLTECGMMDRVEVWQESHVHMNRYVGSGEVDGIVFNFGYLPGGDHHISTSPDTSVAAIQTGLELLRRGGMMSLCIYSGGDTGYEEKEAILRTVKQLDQREYLVMVCQYYNRLNDPPLPVMIWKT